MPRRRRSARLQRLIVAALARAPPVPSTLIVPPNAANIAAAAAHLRGGELVAFPTETVYGLGGDATNERAVAAIYRAKGRPSRNPLIVHVADAAAARRVARFDSRARRLAEAFWPGPLTLVLPRSEPCAVVPRVSAGLATIAVRVPSLALARDLLEASAIPVAAPSANPSGRVSATTAQHVAEAFGDSVAMILDGGPCPLGIESTVVGLAGDDLLLLRPGAVSGGAIEAVIGPLRAPPAAEPNTGLAAPGMLDRHYAPRLPLRLGALDAAGDEGLLSFGDHAITGVAAERNLSPAGDLDEAAANLFRMLRELDRPDHRAIAVTPIPDHGVGVAINDRLRRAAGGR